LSCAAFSLAAPTQAISGSVKLSGQANVTIKTRGSGVTSIPDILTRVVGDVQPIVSQLNYITSANNTHSIVNPLLTDVQTTLNQAISDVKALNATAVNGATNTVTGAWNTADLAGLVSQVLHLVLTTLGKVLSTLSIAEYNLIFPLLAQVGSILGNLLSLIIAIVGPKDLVPALLPLIQDLLPIIQNLGISANGYASIGASVN
ncbi:hypothetical protein K435DRAFT_163864, partial [Dendrothele bispora CBS 962.96]